MSLYLDDAPAGWLAEEYRARYAVAPMSHAVLDKKHINFDTLIRVDRSPCFYCGTRKDIGCEHQGPAA